MKANNRTVSPITHIKRKLGMDKEMNQTLKEIKEEFGNRTAGVEYSWDLRDFLMLMNLAEYGYLGKTHAILYALKVGYLTGQEELKNFIFAHFGKEDE